METTSRAGAVAMGIRLEAATVVCMAAEAVIALIAGLMARSVLLTAFGIDSVVELLSGAVLLWRFRPSRGVPASRGWNAWN